MNVNVNKNINFLGFDELSVKELTELDEIEEDMQKGKKIYFNNIIYI